MNVLARFLRFGIVGGSGVVVDMAALYVLHDPTRLALPLVLSKVLSAQLAMINNFVWNEAWTFADRLEATGVRARLFRFFKFELICLAGLAINLGVLTLCVRRLGLHYLVANLVAIAISTAWNFLVNLRFNWSARTGAQAS